MTRPLLLCFAGDVWDGNPHSRHHIMRRLAGDWEVLFVEGIPMRSVAGGGRTELRRIAGKLRSAGGLRTVAPSLHVLRPPPIPPLGILGRRAQLSAVRASIAHARRRLSLDGPAVTWFSLPTMAPLRGRLGEVGSVLYYQDRYDAFSHVDAEWLSASLAELARGCDLSLASAEELAGDLRAYGADPIVVPHGVETERFREDPPPPEELEQFERPLVGYVGIVDDYLDFDSLLATADRLERGALVLVGGANTDVGPLERHPRITLLGRSPYEAIPAYLSAFDCCLIPFAITPLTVAVNPIKLREYLAAGRPVVSTPMPEVLPYRDVVSIADGGAPFADATMASLDPSNDTAEARRLRRARVRGESWDAVAARIDSLLRELLPSS